MPMAGTPWRDSRPKYAGNRPSFAAAYGISAQIMVQPLSAPKPETITAIATRSPAQLPPPAIVLAATEYDALLASSASSADGMLPNTASSDSRYTTAAASVPNTVAFGMLRRGSRT